MLVCALYLFIIDDKKESTVDNENLTLPKNSCILPASNQIIKKTTSLLYIVGFCLFLLGLMASLRGSVYSIYLNKSFPHLGLHWLGIIFMLNPIIVVLFQTPVANFIDKKNKLLIMGWGIFLYGFGSFILSFASVFSLAILSCVILTIGEMLSFATIPLIFYEGGDEDTKGRYIGLSQSIYGISVVVGPSIGAIIYSHLGGLFLWSSCGIIGCVCLLICYLAVKSDLYIRTLPQD